MKLDTTVQHITEHASTNYMTVNVTVETECRKQQFTCANGECVSAEVVQNGVDDCGDGSDETSTHGLCDNIL